MIHCNPAALSVSPKRPWECCRDFRRCPMSLRLHRDGHHLRFGIGSHWYLFADNEHVRMTHRVYIYHQIPPNVGKICTIHGSFREYKYKWNIKNKFAFLKQRESQLPDKKQLAPTICFRELRHLRRSSTSHLGILMWACIYNLHHSSLKACNRYHH